MVKKVSKKTGIALQKLGFNQGVVWYINDDPNDTKTEVTGKPEKGYIPAPCVLEAWDWLWTHTTIKLEPYYSQERNVTYVRDNETDSVQSFGSLSPAEIFYQVLDKCANLGLLC